MEPLSIAPNADAGFRNLAVTMAACAALWVWQPAALVWVHDQFLPLLTAAIMFTFAFSAWLYAASFIGNKRLAAYGSSGYWLYDFWMGRELNPRWGQLDLKEFCELYPGLSGGLFTSHAPRACAEGCVLLRVPCSDRLHVRSEPLDASSWSETVLSSVHV